MSYGLTEDLPQHAGKTIEARRFEKYTAMPRTPSAGYATFNPNPWRDEMIIEPEEEEKDLEYAEAKKHWMKYFNLPVNDDSVLLEARVDMLQKQLLKRISYGR